MSKCLDRNKDFLKILMESTEDQRHHLIQNASPDQIRVLSEISLNILSGNLPLKSRHIKKLTAHKRMIRKLANSRVPHKVKKVLINQTGGFLPLLVSPVLSALGVVVGKVISSQLGL